MDLPGDELLSTTLLALWLSWQVHDTLHLTPYITRWSPPACVPSDYCRGRRWGGGQGPPCPLSRVGGSEFIVGIGTRRDTTDGRDLLLLSPPAATGGNCQSDSHESESHLRPVVRSLLCHFWTCSSSLASQTPWHPATASYWKAKTRRVSDCHGQYQSFRHWKRETNDKFIQFGFESSFRSEVTYKNIELVHLELNLDYKDCELRVTNIQFGFVNSHHYTTARS